MLGHTFLKGAQILHFTLYTLDQFTGHKECHSSCDSYIMSFEILIIKSGLFLLQTSSYPLLGLVFFYRKTALQTKIQCFWWLTKDKKSVYLGLCCFNFYFLNLSIVTTI